VHFHITSGNTEQVAEILDRGLLDFAVIVEPPNLSRYNYMEIPGVDTWGLVVRKDHPLAKKKHITADDLIGLDLICSDQSMKADIPRWCGEKIDLLCIIWALLILSYNWFGLRTGRARLSVNL